MFVLFLCLSLVIGLGAFFVGGRFSSASPADARREKALRASRPDDDEWNEHDDEALVGGASVGGGDEVLVYWSFGVFSTAQQVVSGF